MDGQGVPLGGAEIWIITVDLRSGREGAGCEAGRGSCRDGALIGRYTFNMPCKVSVERGIVHLSGHLDETVDFGSLHAAHGALKISFREVISISSIGLAKLMNFVQLLSGRDIEFHECPEILIDAINTIPRLLGPKRDAKIVKSLYFPCSCGTCRREVQQLVLTAQLVTQGRSVFFPPAVCQHCGTLMRLDADPEDYLAFLFGA
jgi:hypothetical protein